MRDKKKCATLESLKLKSKDIKAINKSNNNNALQKNERGIKQKYSMNTKLKKQSIFSIFTLVICMSCLFLNSCKSDMDEPQASGKLSYTPEQKAEIMALAKKYEVNCTIDEETSAKELLSMASIEKVFQEANRLTHTKMKMVRVKDGESKSMKIKGMSKIAPSTETITGEWHTIGSDLDVKVTWVKGDAFTPNSATVNTSLTDLDEDFQSYSQTEKTWYIGQVDFTFTFKGKAIYDDYYNLYEGSGRVDMNTGIGEVSWTITYYL